MERIPMSEKDLKRLEVLERVKSGRTGQASAARVLGISTRQTRRLLRRLEQEGPRGIISRKVGAAGNHKLPLASTEAVLAFCRQPEQKRSVLKSFWLF